MLRHMNDYCVDDIVICKLKDGHIISRADKVYDEKISLKIIGVKVNEWDVDEFVVYVPDYDLHRVKTSIRVSRYLCTSFSIDARFIGEHMTYIRTSHIVDTEWRADGMRCNRCQEYFQWAGPNMADGSFTCVACLENPWR